MYRVLFLDKDPSFIIAAQKLLPKGTEWLATMELTKAVELIDALAFDTIIVRKRNEQVMRELLQRETDKLLPEERKFLKKLVILPRVFWKRGLKRGFCAGG